MSGNQIKKSSYGCNFRIKIKGKNETKLIIK